MSASRRENSASRSPAAEPQVVWGVRSVSALLLFVAAGLTAGLAWQAPRPGEEFTEDEWRLTHRLLALMYLLGVGGLASSWRGGRLKRIGEWASGQGLVLFAGFILIILIRDFVPPLRDHAALLVGMGWAALMAFFVLRRRLVGAPPAPPFEPPRADGW